MTQSISELAARWLRRPGKLTDAEKRVLQSTIERTSVAQDVSKKYAATSGFGGRLSDVIARVGGSWAFIVSFLVFIALWAGLNGWLLGRESFDPYPFIFLNLVLSMLAAIQAPIIMMSQNRQAARDRLDATHDYEVNLKAEIEIMGLHEKLDEMRHREIQSIHELVTLMGEKLERLESKLLDSRP